mgnify:CR=1 FL=1
MPITPDQSLHDQGVALLAFIRRCLGPTCTQRAYVSLGEPPVVTDSLVVWRHRGPYQATPENPASRLKAVDWAVTLGTCCQPVAQMTPNGQVRLAGTADLEAAARVHNTRLGTVLSILDSPAKLAELFGPQAARDIGPVEANPAATQAVDCFSDTIIISGVRWWPTPCGSC